MDNKLHTDIDIIRKVKQSIEARKYAHADEISLLWQYAMKSTETISWSKIMLMSLAICIIITLFAY
ncbi:MAG: 3-oxoacyl-ACP synthase [Providencia heimbachae]|nr:3-oxoacyl-ACP synthase [Providencia heimbachae]